MQGQLIFLAYTYATGGTPTPPLDAAGTLWTKQLLIATFWGRVSNPLPSNPPTLMDDTSAIMDDEDITMNGGN